MKTIKVDKERLLKTLIDNKNEHIREYEEALTAYHENVIAKLTNMLEEAKCTEIGDPLPITVNLHKPVNYVDDYEEAITMLEWTLEDVIELDQATSKKYLCDEWGWTDSFKTLNSTYLSLSR